MMPVLALTMEQIIIYGIAILAVLGGIFGENSKKKKQQGARPAKTEADLEELASASEDDADEAEADPLAEIARRRKLQLQALARQRRQAGSAPAQTQQAPANPAVGYEPSRSAASDRQDDARQQQAAGAMEREQSQARPQDAVRADARSAATSERAETDRRRAQQRAADLRQRAQQQRQTRQQRPVVRPAPARPQTSAPEPKPAPQTSLGESISTRQVSNDALGRGVEDVQDSPPGFAEDTDSVHRHVSDAPVAQAGPRLGLLARTGVHSWRDVIMLKEILDPPISDRIAGAALDPLHW